MDAALTALRESTAQTHQALEDRPLTRRLMSREVTLEDYRTFLQAQRAVFQPWVEAYPHLLRRACRCDPEARLDALHMDLAVLHDGVLDDPPLGDFRFTWGADAPEWYGALYVFEGSRLGGRVVANHLRRHLGLCVAGALRYLDPVNEASCQPAWSTVLQCLQRQLDATTVPAAIAGAHAVFERFHCAFAGVESQVVPAPGGAMAV